MRKPKTNLQLMKEVRIQWEMNPVTRGQKNEKKDIKKIRHENKKSCLFRNDEWDFFICRKAV